ncbi:MAG: DUF975 family protein [Saccharofermentanales bacterium]
MWERSDLKQRAKAVLKKDYWKAFLISFVIAFAAGGTSGSGTAGSGVQFRMDDNDNFFTKLANFDFDWATIVAISGIVGIVIMTMVLFGIAIRVFLGYPLEVGGRRYFIQTAQETEANGYFAFVFQSGHYMNVVVSMILKDVQLFLWTLLFIIPGIIKSFSYRMVPYILAQNPTIGAKRAIELSRQMTRGSKFNIFILDISFFWWYMLGLLACCIGVIFVRPYVDMTMAELYIDLSKNALANGFCTPEELGLVMEASARVE